MQLSQYIINAFTRDTFAGNPAAVVPLLSWLPDDVMQAIAAQNNLSETAFYVKSESNFQLRWFTPVTEVDFCGHATLAAGYVVMQNEQSALDSVIFATRTGVLQVKKHHEEFILDFPVQTCTASSAIEQVSDALGVAVESLYAGEDYMAVLKNQQYIEQCRPDMHKLKQLDLRGVIITAPGNNVDFVSRFFAPKAGIDEDPVTGSAHCMLAPYWSAQMHKSALSARQLSARGGEMRCEIQNKRVIITASAKMFARATIYLD